MLINIQSWVEALITWAKENSLDVDYYMDASHDIAKLMEGPLLRNFLENVVYAAPNIEKQESSIAV